jgi:hypothetical protein
MIAHPEVTAEALTPLWERLGALAGARELFEEIRGRGNLEAETDEDSFY